jgi:hypothetical protein
MPRGAPSSPCFKRTYLFETASERYTRPGMSEKQKRLLFLAFFITFSLGMGYVVYLMLFRSPGVTPEPSPTEENYTGTLPSPAGGKATSTAVGATTTRTFADSGFIPRQPTQPTIQAPIERNHLLFDGHASAASGNSNGNGARFYNGDDGRFYRMNADGTMERLGDKQFFNVKDVSWGKESNQAILEFPDGSNVYYDFEAKRQVILPKFWENFDFAPDDKKIVAKSIGTDPQNRYLITANPDGTEAKAIEPLGENADRAFPTWSPNGQFIGYTNNTDPQPENGQQIVFLGQNRENFKSMNVPGQDFLPNWSPTGKNILYSVWNTTSDNKPSLWVSSGSAASLGSGRRNLKINTWADKCTWATETDLYCGVPQDLPENAGLARSEFSELADDIYHIDLETGSAVKINTPDAAFPVENPVVDKSQSKLFYTDASTGKLYSLDLK